MTTGSYNSLVALRIFLFSLQFSLSSHDRWVMVVEVVIRSSKKGMGRESTVLMCQISPFGEEQTCRSFFIIHFYHSVLEDTE